MFIINNRFSKEYIKKFVVENKEDLEMIVEYLQSFDMPWVHINDENITMYEGLWQMPTGYYLLNGDRLDSSTNDQLKHYMETKNLESIQFSFYDNDEIQVVTFMFRKGGIGGFYWVDPDLPTEKAYTSHHELAPLGNGWGYEEGDTNYYTEKICDRWYFFAVLT